MRTIEKKVENEIIINKSRFITVIYPVNNIDEINTYLNNIKEEYKGATHYCYAYILNNISRCSDDGEPSKTAGYPMLNVITNQNINNILVIVIRYFGGIKLGAGGLVRAYSNSVSECLKNAEIITLNEGIEFSIEFNYDDIKQIDYLLNNYQIINKEYNEYIKYTIVVKKEEFERLEKSLKKLKINISKIKETYIREN